MAKKHLLIGSGAAGLSALRQIRNVSGEDQIKMVTMEDNLPYSPTALPYLLSGKIEESKLWTVDETFFKETRSELKTGKKLVRIASDRDEVEFEGGERETFDTLLLATGSEPVLPPINGIDTIPVLGFHTLKDYHELVSRLRPKKCQVLIYGGGLVAMGLASNLLKRGCGVKVLVRSRILRRYFDATAGALIARAFVENGAEIITGHEVERVAAKGKGVELLLTNGTKVSGNILVNCLGTAPRIDFLQGSGISVVKDGILVDGHMRTTRANIYAAGDVAVSNDFFTHKEGANAILPSAMEQGKIAGANMAGEARDYTGWISMNVFHFFGKSAAAIGLSNGLEGVDTLTDGSEQKGHYTKLNVDNGRLVGVQLVNVPVDPGVLLYLIKNRVDVGPFKEQLLQAPGEMSRALMTKKERE